MISGSLNFSYMEVFFMRNKKSKFIRYCMIIFHRFKIPRLSLLIDNCSLVETLFLKASSFPFGPLLLCAIEKHVQFFLCMEVGRSLRILKISDKKARLSNSNL